MDNPVCRGSFYTVLGELPFRLAEALGWRLLWDQWAAPLAPPALRQTADTSSPRGTRCPKRAALAPWPAPPPPAFNVFISRTRLTKGLDVHSRRWRFSVYSQSEQCWHPPVLNPPLKMPGEKPYGSFDGDSKAHSSCAAEFIPMSS